jgi:signal transduction histidine kinase
MGAMARLEGRRRVGWLAAVVSSALAGAAMVIAVLFDHRLGTLGRPDLKTFAPETWVIVAAIASSLVVGCGLTVRRPEHPVGWLFLALAVSLAIAGAIDGYAVYAAAARPGTLPAAGVVARAGDVIFVPWLVTLAAILHLTPTGRPLTRNWDIALWATVAGGVIAVVAALFGGRELDPPLADVDNPWKAGAFAPAVDAVGIFATMAVGVGLITAGASIVVRYRRSVDTERRQLQWMYLAALPLALFVPAAFVSSWTGHPAPLLIATGGFIVTIPVAAGLAITRYHLYDVDRVLSRAFTYVAWSVLLAVTYGVVVVGAGRALSGLADSSAVAASIATLTAVTIAWPARNAIQDALDRRFNRRRFEAVRLVEDWIRDPRDGEIDVVIRRAVGDPALTVAYWSSRRGLWSSPAGSPTTPAADAVEVARDGAPIARVSYSVTAVDRQLVEAVCEVAASELDNAHLRAAISLQLVEVNESRARLAAAQTTERRRLERNLHDGAQQRLLALAMTLQAAQLNGSNTRLREALADGVEELQATVGELRDLANGLHPLALSDGGIAAALDDLARRSPLTIEVDATGLRFDPDIEACAWFVSCEAVANAQKHAGASCVRVDVAVDDGWLDLTVDDDGRGGADPRGSGLQGVRDRVEAAGGSLEVADRAGGGTRVHARLPCES